MRTVFVVALAAAGCSAGSMQAKQPAPQTDAVVAPSPKAENPGAQATAWEADPRWGRAAADVESAAQSAWPSAQAATGFALDRGRRPLIAYDAAAPVEGDVVVRFVDGVRRPVARVRPQALLSGEFVVPDDLTPLMARACLLCAAGDRALPEWVVAGGAIVAGGAFDRRVHVRALGGPEIRSHESELFGDVQTDALAAAARVKALVRIARGDRPLTRFVTALADGHDEDTALNLVGVSDRAFLEAAAGTERARAAAAIAGDPALPVLVAARAALAQIDVAAADAALASLPVATDPWVMADAQLCRALVAAVRSDVAGAKAALEAAPEARIVRLPERRIVEAYLAPAAERDAAARAVLGDWPDIATTNPAGAALLGLAAGLPRPK